MYTPLFLIAGLALLWLGLRGRRLDDHPICARCGFDLIGTLHTFADRATDTPRVCPECAAEIYRPRAMRHGARRRRPRLIVAGALLAAMSSAILATTIWLDAANLSVLSLEPFWMVRRAALGDGPAAIEAQQELIRRIQDGKLSASSTQKLISDALARQPLLDKPWQLWGDIFSAADIAGTATPAQRQTFTDNLVQLRIRPRPTVTAGTPLRFDITTWTRGPAGIFRGRTVAQTHWAALRVAIQSLSIDGRDVPVPPSWLYHMQFGVMQSPSLTVQVGPGRFVSIPEPAASWAPTIPDSAAPPGSPYATAPNTPGQHTLQATLRLTPGRNLVYISANGPWTLADVLPPLDLTVKAPIEILPASSPDLRAVTDDKQLDVFADGLRTDLDFFGPNFRFVGSPPADQRHLAFQVLLELIDPNTMAAQRVPLGNLIAIRGEWSEPEHNLQIGPDLMTRARIQGTIRLLLRPSFDLAKRWFTAGEVTVGKDIVVEAQVR